MLDRFTVRPDLVPEGADQRTVMRARRASRISEMVLPRAPPRGERSRALIRSMTTGTV
jgi:hypothetical protein